MDLITITYFHEGEGICSNDFNEVDRKVKLNSNFILSLTEPERFQLPFTGGFVANYATLKMSNGDIYYLREDGYEDLKEVIDKRNKQ